MAATTTAAAPARGKGKEFLGQPAWMWAVGGGVILIGYLYIRSRSKTAGQQPGSGQGQQRPYGAYAGGPHGWTSQTFSIWVRQHDGGGHRPPREPRPRPGPGPGPGQK